MFEAFKVGVTLALQNQVSGVLGFIARDFIKVNAQAKVLQGTLKEIKLLGMGGALLAGGGFLGLDLIARSVKPASEYVHQLELAKAAMKDLAPARAQLEIAQMTAAAWQTTSNVMTTTAAENVAAMRELRMVFGNTDLAVAHVGTVQKLQAILQDVRGSGAKDEAYTVAKALELKGDVKNVSQFDSAADLMTKAIIASGGKVGATDFHSTFKYGRSATIGWDNQFTYGILPTLIQEMKTRGGSGGGGGGPGNALMSAYAEVVGGSIPQRSLKVWQKLGLLDPSKIVWDKVGSAKGVAPGGIQGTQEFIQNPYSWVKEFLLPALEKAGYTTEAQKKEAIQYLFPNRTSGFVMGQMALQGWKFDRDQKLIAQAGGLDSYDELIKNDPKMAWTALAAQWENLKTAIGITVVPIMLPALRGLTAAFNTLGRFLQKHPTITSALTITFTSLSAFAALAGTIMVAGAGLKLINTAFGTMRLLPLAGMAVSIGSVATALGILGGAVAAFLLITRHKEVADWIDQKTNGKVGDLLLKMFPESQETSQTYDAANQRSLAQKSYAPPASNPTAKIDVQVRDPYHLAKVVTHQQNNMMNRPPTSGGAYDGRQSFVSPAYNNLM